MLFHRVEADHQLLGDARVRRARGQVLEDLAARWDRLGIAHSGIYETGTGPRLDVPDPDGTVVRFTATPAPPTGSPARRCAAARSSGSTTPHGYTNPPPSKAGTGLDPGPGARPGRQQPDRWW